MKRSCRTLLLAALLCSATPLLSTSDAEAFCGFYVSGADQEMFNNATQVVMMREGTKTILSMRNNYDGPAKDFAMVVPVPVVLQKEHVKVLPDAIFTRVDTLAAPRLVEYWEQDPCTVYPDDDVVYEMASAPEADAMPVEEGGAADYGVKIEAQFDVGEYNVVILSAKESNGLERWLIDNKYNIPGGAREVLQSYISQGQYFFVAKVDIKKVQKDPATDKTMLSPLRFHYDSDDFQLPVRLGLLNAKGYQDLLIHILSREGRFEVANYKNVAIPTNLVVSDKVRKNFAEFYVSLFDYVLKENPKAVVTEYSWDASSCDPCPSPPLDDSEIFSLGADVLLGATGDEIELQSSLSSYGWTLTRLHARYTAKELEEDLVFRSAPPIVGGRGMPYEREGKLNEEGAQQSGYNNFQGRYVMLNRWTGEVTCENPQYGVWGGPPLGAMQAPTPPATNTAFVARDAIQLADALETSTIPAAQLLPEGPHRVDLPTPLKKSVPAVKRGCHCSQGAAPQDELPLMALTLVGAGLLRLRTRRRRD